MSRCGQLWSVFLLLAAFQADPSFAGDWPHFRGPSSDGHSPETGLPITWNETAEGLHNIAWKVEVPGQGWSSPVVQGGRVWMTSALEEKRSLRALAFDSTTGEMVVDIEVFRPEAWQPDHPENSYASPTPALEPGRVYVHFGTYGTALLDAANGSTLWESHEIQIDHEVGPGSSPLIYKDLLLVHFDGTDRQLVAAFRKDTGEIAWATPRTLDPNQSGAHKKSFSTPIVVTHDGAPQMISPGSDQVVAYDPASGAEIWKVQYEGYSVVPQPVAGHGRVYVDTGYIKPHLLAIRLGGRGDVTDTHVDWDYYWQVPANPSPLLIGERIFLISDWGNASWIDVMKGDDVWRQRLRGDYRASPLYAEGRIYVFGVDGDAVVLEPGESFRQLAENQIAGVVRATPAIAEGAIFVRTESHLYRIEEARQGEDKE